MENEELKKFKDGFAGNQAAQAETTGMVEDAVADVAPPVVDQQAAPGEPEPVAEAQVVEPEMDETPMTPEEAHKEAAWAGQLRKREEELKAREAALASKDAPVVEDPAVAEEAMAEGETVDEEMTEEPGEDVAEANLDDPATAMARIEADFGEDFLRMIKAAFNGFLAETLAEIDPKLSARFQALESGLSGLAEGLSASHYESIEEAHPDYLEIAADPAFSEWIASLPEEESMKANEIAKGGSSRQVIKLLAKFKEGKGSMQAEQDDNDSIDEAAMKAAAGVRSNSVSPVITNNQSTDPMEAFRRGFRNAGK